MTRHRTSFTGVLAALGAAVLWGTTGTAQALGPEGSDPVAVGALRILLGAAVLLLLAARSGLASTVAPGDRSSLPPGRRTALLLGGGVCVAAYQVCFFVGVDRAGVAVGTVVALGVAPLATGLLGTLLGERPGTRWTVATAGAVVGIVLLVSGTGGAAGRLDPLGVAAAVGAGAAYAGFTTAARSLLLHGARGTTVMAVFFALGALLLLPLLPTTDLRWLGSPAGLAAVAWLGIAATGLAYLLFQHALSRLPAGTVATLSLLEPVTAALLGVLVLREQLSGLTATGIVVVVGSLLVVALPGRSRPATDGAPPRRPADLR